MTEADLTTLAKETTLGPSNLTDSQQLFLAEGYLALLADHKEQAQASEAMWAEFNRVVAERDALKEERDGSDRAMDKLIDALRQKLESVVTERDAIKARLQFMEDAHELAQEKLDALVPPVPACPQCMVLDVEGVWLKEHTDGTWTCGNCEEDIEEEPTYYRQVRTGQP